MYDDSEEDDDDDLDGFIDDDGDDVVGDRVGELMRWALSRADLTPIIYI